MHAQADADALLQRLQQGLSLVAEPWQQLATEFGVDADRLLEQVRQLRAGGIIREVSGIFDVAALGYRQTLAAMELPAQAVDSAGEFVAGHPGVSHCYSRSGSSYNPWFTLALSPASCLGLGRTLEVLARRCGAGKCLNLPAIKRYKLEVQFGASGHTSPSPAPSAPPATATPLTDEQRKAIVALQQDLPCCPRPFAALAAQAGLSEARLLELGRQFQQSGWLRRYAAVLHHLAAGAKANVLVAWAVAPSAADAAGARCAGFRSISHCYLRPAAGDWPYTLYTMIHGRDRQDCAMTIDEIVAVTGLHDRAELWTVRQFAKRRVRLFTDDEARWESNILTRARGESE